MNLTFKILFVFFICISVFAQSSKTHKRNVKNLKCTTCHSCEIPTKENPCINECPREIMTTVQNTNNPDPETITMNRIVKEKDIYKPVIFSHKLHSGMSTITGGCKSCHHYNQLEKIIKCSECHDPNGRKKDINKPDLEGAYHQQCLNCHRSWSHTVECTSCHGLNSSKNVKTKDYSGKKHPNIFEPEKKVYTTNSKSGKYVTFYHKQHTSLYQLDCGSCHSNSSCATCHDKSPQKQKNTDKKTQHMNCSSCHNTNTNCNFCHSKQIQPAFNHFTRTGFQLKEYHKELNCAKCHTNKSSFKGLSSSCANCHGKWREKNFNHKVTGLILNETHMELSCTDCHVDNNYLKPECNGCHDDYRYPTQIPGKKLK